MYAHLYPPPTHTQTTTAPGTLAFHPPLNYEPVLAFSGVEMVGANWAVSGAEESSMELIQWHRQPLQGPTDRSTFKVGEALGKVFENNLHSSQAIWFCIETKLFISL